MRKPLFSFIATRYLVWVSILFLLTIPRMVHAASDSLYVQLKWWPQFQFAGYYAAELKGYYANEGLKVKLRQGDKGISPITEVLSGRAQLGIDGTELVVEYAKGSPLVALGAIFQHSPYTIISLRKKRINMPSDLMGKRLMASLEQGWVELQAMLLREGISPDSVHLLAHTWRNEDLLNDSTDAFTGYITVELNQLKKMGADVSYIMPINYGIDFYGDVLFSTRKQVDARSTAIQKFRKASFEGWAYAMEHPEEIAAYILSLPGVKERGATMEDLLAEANAMQGLILPKLVELGHMNEGRWKHIVDVYRQLNLISGEPDLDRFLYDGTRKVNTVGYRNLLYVIGTVLGLLLVLLLYGMSLRRAVQRRTRELQREMAQRAQTQELLAISERRLEMATFAAGLGIWDWNIKDNEVYYNDQWKTMLGYAPNELSNDFETFEQLLHPEEKEALMQQLNDHIEGRKESYQAIIRLRTRDKRWKWILTVSKANERNAAGIATHLSGIHLDVEDIKQKEIELQELSRELMNSNRELQQFAYITSHNLRAPVANLVSLLGLVDRTELSERNMLLLKKTEISVDKLLRTLNDLNEILSSRINQSDAMEALNFKDEVNGICDMLAEDIRTNNVQINCNFARVPTILYSGKVLRSILLNLITNAIKYRRQDVPLQISISTENDGEYVLLTVKDNGSGIDMEKYGNKIFGLYQRFHEGKEGKGLGLYIIKHQVEALEGKIAVESIVNQGTIFQVFLKKKRPLHV